MQKTPLHREIYGLIVRLWKLDQWTVKNKHLIVSWTPISLFKCCRIIDQKKTLSSKSNKVAVKHNSSLLNRYKVPSLKCYTVFFMMLSCKYSNTGCCEVR